MSDSNIYTKELEKLIVTRLLPVYAKYCSENNIDIFDSGIPSFLLTQFVEKRRLPALLKPKK